VEMLNLAFPPLQQPPGFFTNPGGSFLGVVFQHRPRSDVRDFTSANKATMRTAAKVARW